MNSEMAYNILLFNNCDFNNCKAHQNNRTIFTQNTPFKILLKLINFLLYLHERSVLNRQWFSMIPAMQAGPSPPEEQVPVVCFNAMKWRKISDL